jgi:hypothetical protein
MWTTTLASRLAAAALAGALGLSIGGAGVAAAAAPDASSGRGTNLHIVVQPSAAAPGASFTDAITVMNVGQDSVRDVTITVPFDASALRLVGVQFNQPGAWVTSTASNEFQAHLGRIGSQNEAVQASVSFAELPGFATTSALPTSIAYRYSSNGDSHSGTVTTELLATQEPAIVQPASASMTVIAGGTLPLDSAIFAPDEAVAFWYNTPAGQALPLYVRDGQITSQSQHNQHQANGTTHEVDNGAYLNADDQGAIATTLTTTGLEPGVYSLVAHGLNSSATKVVTFRVQ